MREPDEHALVAIPGSRLVPRGEFTEGGALDELPDDARFRAGGREVLAVHGDGLTEEHWSAALMHRITRHPAAIALYRAVHPDAGIALVDRLSHRLGDATRNPAVLQRAAVRQRAWAEQALRDDPTLGLVTLGHTHIPANVESDPGRLYVNPGAWMDGLRYAVVTAGGADLRKWGERGTGNGEW